jgi:phospholipid/cholesterol/gamma-HCH transport system substrate-binding protein
METRLPSRGAIAIMVAFALSVTCFTLFVWRSFGGTSPLEPQGYRFHVSFGPDAAQLTSNAETRIAGVPVGRVVSVAARGRRIDAVIELQPRFVPLPADARAIYRVKTLLGESFIELSPGDRAGPKLPDGGSLPVAQVEAAQPLVDVLGTFDEPTRRSFRRLVRGLAAAVRGRGSDLNATLGNAGPGIDGFSRVAGILDRSRPMLRALIRDGGTALQAVGSRDRQLQRLVTSGEQVLGATAARDRSLLETVRALPPFLRELRSTLTAVQNTATDAAPVLRDLQPAARVVGPAIAEATALAPEARAFFRELGPVIDATRRGFPAATRIVDASRPLVRALHPSGRELAPVVELLAAYRREMVASIANAAASTNGSTPLPGGGRQHYVRVIPTVFSEQVFGYGKRLPTNRYNPYVAPNGQDKLAHGGLLSWDCRHEHNSSGVLLPAQAPPCLVQRPWTFRRATRSYPHVERDAP